MALILSVETSATTCSVALHDNGHLVNALTVSEGQAHAAKLAVLIDDLFKESQFDINEIKAVALSAGPGSFTGLRIGTSTVKGICYALNVPLIAITTLDLLAFQVKKKMQDNIDFLVPMIDAKRMEVYCQIVDRDLRLIRPPAAQLITEVSFAELLEHKKVLFFGDGAEKCITVLKHPNALFESGVTPQASALGEMAFPNYERGAFQDLAGFAPLYLKEFIAKKAQSVF
jgi:tRNA threonylcarbamoyladenosine biosynthesis protein TsaB